jgi:alkanesulfonate monooxygenase SsuD/methylene tetrahydromethanopterin reductase-like flavin-dependent oxidoreductase (luciferase family)
VSFGLALPLVSNLLDPGQFFAEIAAEVLMAERCGFDICLVPEHHGGPSSALSDPIVTVSWLLAQTTTIKVATGVLILPLHSIPRLAEQCCMLQHASGGRFLVGIGAGYQPADFATFGVDLNSRGQAMTDGVNSLIDAWRLGELNGYPIRPELQDQPPPPLHIGAWAPSGLRRAALQGDGWIADPIRSLAEIEDAAHQYRSLANDAGRPSQVMVMREAWIGDSDVVAADTFGPIVEPIFRYYLRHGAFPPNSSLKSTDLTLPLALADRVLCGSAETLVDRITELVERTSADTVVFGVRHPLGPAHEEVLTAIERLGREVRPAVQARLDADGNRG